MPCDDVRERIEIRVDSDDQLTHYSLTKNTCGSPVGHEGLLLNRLKGLSVFNILRDDDRTWLDGGPKPNDVDEFLYFKHLFALRAALGAVYGVVRGGPEDTCALASVGCDLFGARIEGLISVEAVTRDIQSCGHCGGCGA